MVVRGEVGRLLTLAVKDGGARVTLLSRNLKHATAHSTHGRARRGANP
jgi:hypothetical protein